MPLRPIDAIFVDPEQRSYVVYYRGALWKLPRMKMDDRSWQNRRPFKEGSRAIYLSIHQAISDPVLAQKLRTLDLPVAVHGSTLPRFEGWWEMHGFKWLEEQLSIGQSPLAAHKAAREKKAIDDQSSKDKDGKPVVTFSIDEDIFADMLAELTSEVLDQKL